MMKETKGVSLWNHAKKVIPGGTQLLSKRSEQFLPDLWPSYFKKAKGIEIWDLDGNRFIDASLMGVGTCILGYADDDVNSAVKDAVDSGSMATLNSPEEVDLTDVLLSLHKWAGMVRFARTGGESMAVAVRIARAFTEKDAIAFCGYHGWHDWYISSNLSENHNLDGHLLPGLAPLGVPRCLKNTAFPFQYNKIEELKQVFEQHDDIGIVVVEPVRHFLPENNFLNEVQKIAAKHDAVLIFDEISSGWRINAGAAFTQFNVTPDIVVYGKAMSNGFPMAAIVGRSEIMNAAQSTFISSTYWTERIGPVAALATIDKLRKYNIPPELCKMGRIVADGWRKAFLENDLDAAVQSEGIPSVPTFTFNYGDNNLIFQTFFTQEMLQRGYLASRTFYLSHCHRRNDIEVYLENAYEVFARLSGSMREGEIKGLLHGPPAHSGFKRLN